MKIAICIATYRRPAQLSHLLRSLDLLAFTTSPAPILEVTIVDNDPAASARPIVLAHRPTQYTIAYHGEPRPGISHARNAAIEHATDADFIAFIDDDEYPAPDWLDQLLTAQREFKAPIIAGRVIPVLAERCECTWVPDRPRRAAGTRMSSAGAGNVLISRAVLNAMGPAWFDPRFGSTGGEDTHFFRRCLDKDFSIVWADDAVVYEFVPSERTTTAYACARIRNGANQWTRVEMDLHPSPIHLARRFVVGLLRIAQGTAMSLLPSRQFRGKLLVEEGIGNLHAFFGGSYKAYGAHER